MTSKTQLRAATLLLPLFAGTAFAACSSTSSTKNAGGPSGGGSSSAASGNTVGTDGSTVTMGSDGSTVTMGSDGSTVTSGTDGTVTSSVTNGTVTSSTTGTTTGGAAASTSAGGASSTGQTTSTGGAATTDGGTTDSATTGATTGGGGPAPDDGPCDIYEDGGTPCVAAYSMVRRLLSTYDGPLYQVRSGSNNMNTGNGGETHDIGSTAEGFADAAAQDAACAGTTCTISILYDQSGMGNDITVAKAGQSAGGDYADDDDFESLANRGPITVNGHDVYSLYMEARQGYRQQVVGNGMPVGTESQGTYMLADGTHYGTACCWDFGNVTNTPANGWHFMDTLFFGVAYWGRGAGNGPWFMADFEAGVWAGGSNPGEPGWGALDSDAPPNENNPSLAVPFAIGFLKVSNNYSLRMADLESASSLTTAYQGAMPKAVDHQGAVVLGVGGDNSNNSWGTFYEGAIVAGYPSDETEDAVMQNVKSVGYF